MDNFENIISSNLKSNTDKKEFINKRNESYNKILNQIKQNSNNEYKKNSIFNLFPKISILILFVTVISTIVLYLFITNNQNLTNTDNDNNKIIQSSINEIDTVLAELDSLYNEVDTLDNDFNDLEQN